MAKKLLKFIAPLEGDTGNDALRYLSRIHVRQKLRVGFEDGSVRLVDLAVELNGEIFERLKDLRAFRTARLNPDLDTVVWSNGADMSPACGP